MPDSYFEITHSYFAYRPTVSTVVFLMLFQLFLARFVFRNRDFPDITVTVDNRYMYTQHEQTCTTIICVKTIGCKHPLLCRFSKGNVTIVTTVRADLKSEFYRALADKRNRTPCLVLSTRLLFLSYLEAPIIQEGGD